MTRIHILGGTGYAGANIARIAVARGHQVVSFSKTDPAEAGADVTYRSGDLLDDAFLASAFNDTDVVISALSARGPLAREEDFRALLRKIAGVAAERGVRFGVVGGAGSLLVKPDGPRYVDTPEFFKVARPEALVLAGTLDDLRSEEHTSELQSLMRISY